MIIKYFYTLLTFLCLFVSYNTNAKDCLIETSKKILVINSNFKNTHYNIFKKNKCDEETTKDLMLLLVNSSGNLSQRYINEYFLNKKNTPHLNGKIIEVRKIEDLLKKSNLINEGYSFFEISHIAKQNIFAVNDYEKIEISCISCKSVGHKSIYLNFKNSKGHIIRREIVNAVVKKRSVAYFPLRDINQIGRKLSANSFQKKEFYTTQPNNLLNSVKNLQFYKTNKPLRKNKPIKSFDLTPITLIKHGQIVKISLKSDNIFLQSTGLALGTGNYGQMINLRVNNKIISAKITNFNKAEILQ